MPPLAKTLQDVRRRISQSAKRGLNEQNTKATLIEPVLRALGWDTEDVDEVAREYHVKRREKPVDYGLLEMRTPRLFVEAKGLGQNLDDRKWAGQIMGYAAVAGVEWIVLTDGNDYRIYNAHAPVHVDEKLFRRVCIDSEDPLVEATLELLARDRMKENRIEILWRAHFVDRQVRSALEQIFTTDDDMLVVNYVASRVKNLTAEEIRASLHRCNVTLDFPVPKDVGEIVVEKPKRAQKRKNGGKGQHTFIDVTIADLIGAGLLHAPSELEREYKGKFLKARIEKDGRVTFDLDTHNSPSLAGGAARASVIGRKAGGKLPATNGWTFWLTKDESGKLVMLDELRDKYLARSVEGKSGSVGA